jgi:mRNA interferase RelE/StbE
VPWQIAFEPGARRELRSLDRPIQERILKSLAGLAANPHTAPNVKALQGRPGYRIRVGDWRVIYTLQDEVLTVLVIRIAHRREAYR